MSSELFSTQSYIELVTYYKVDKNKHGVVNLTIIKEEDYNKLRLDEKKKEKAKSLKTKWRVPNWRMGNELIEATSFFNIQKNDMDVNWNRYRDARFKASLIDWDAKDSAGNPLPVTAETIDMLPQTVAFALLKQFDDACKIEDETDEKND
jgi:hypothetical protein